MIKLENICKSFGKTEVLKDVNLELKESECIVISGVSGSGKSTLLAILGAIMKPSSGLVEVDGSNIVSLSDFHLSAYRASSVGFVTQSFHLFDMLSVKENVMTPLLLTDMTQKEILDKTAKAMIKASIQHKENQVVSTLSGGEKQRCMIARALVNNPKIILCDEPTANLDKVNSLKFIKILQELKESNKTIVVATHDPLIIELEFVDRVIKIDEGKIE